ncbi:MAG: hypothetical protein K8S25_08100 [Alphaproteobacteria bacterium]|nr:hypothetical protein [Alphaproteobacteria bacterium]
MHQSNRRSAKRYVIDGLMVEIGGFSHDTIDVSRLAVSIVRRADVDYSRLNARCEFKNAKASELNRPIASLEFGHRRGVAVVLKYALAGREFQSRDWENILSRHDVRADWVALEDVFA